MSEGLLPEFEPIPDSAIALDPQSIRRAIDVSQRAISAENRWQIYLNALALESFKAWLEERPDLTLNQAKCIILEPSQIDTPTALCNLQVDRFKLCLIASENSIDATIEVPKIVVDSVDCRAHFYVPIHIYEEQEKAVINGFLSYEQLRQAANASRRLPEAFYELPRQALETDLNRLLLYLTCLEPIAIPLSGSISASSTRQIQQILVQPALNLRNWLQQQWDQMAEDLTWMMLPPLAVEGAMRSATSEQDSLMRSSSEDFFEIVTDLQRDGMRISLETQPAYQDFRLGDASLRLYTMVAITPSIQEEDENFEWSLLIILKANQSSGLPVGIALSVTDMTEVLTRQTIEQSTSADYLFTLIDSKIGEQLLVTIELDGRSLTFPPFQYQSSSVESYDEIPS